MRVRTVCLLNALLCLHAYADGPATKPAELRFVADPARNIFTAGTFSKLDHGKLIGWDDVTAFDDGGASINKNTLRLEGFDVSQSVAIKGRVAIKPEWKWLTVAARVRAFDFQPADNGGAFVRFTQTDEQGHALAKPIQLVPLTEGTYQDWAKQTRSFPIDPKASSLQIEVTLDHCAGAFEIENVLVVPTDPDKELDGDRIEAFQKAIMDNDAETVKKTVAADKRLLEARLHFDGGTPLIMTAFTNRPKMTKLLLDLGADINATDLNWGATAIGWSGFWGRPDVAQVLLDAGADVNSPNSSGGTPLSSAEFAMQSRKAGDATDDERRAVIKLFKDHGGSRKATPKKSQP